MRDVLIYQHQSSLNHGCEALLYTISRQIKGVLPEARVRVASYYREDDLRFDFPCVDEFIDNPLWLRRFTFPWLVYEVDLRLLRSERVQDRFMYCKPCYHAAEGADVCVAIGGDTYCYNKGKEHWPLERKIKRLGKKMMLWGCSVEPTDVPGELAEHLAVFDAITVRDPISYEALCEAGLGGTVSRCADPALLLPVQDCPLPEGWETGGTVGINFSPMAMGALDDKGAPRKALEELVEYILETSDDKVALIPHVRLPFSDDMDELRLLYDKYASSGRMILVDDPSLNARQLKCMISQCKMFVGARTHATIAAYSTCVPTLSIGYSVKARGIARDIYGDEAGKTVPVKGMGGNALVEAYSAICARLGEERAYLERVMPTYCEKALLSGEVFRGLARD